MLSEPIPSSLRQVQGLKNGLDLLSFACPISGADEGVDIIALERLVFESLTIRAEIGAYRVKLSTVHGPPYRCVSTMLAAGVLIMFLSCACNRKMERASHAAGRLPMEKFRPYSSNSAYRCGLRVSVKRPRLMGTVAPAISDPGRPGHFRDVMEIPGFPGAVPKVRVHLPPPERCYGGGRRDFLPRSQEVKRRDGNPNAIVCPLRRERWIRQLMAHLA